jgi:hypothetical protein
LPVAALLRRWRYAANDALEAVPAAIDLEIRALAQIGVVLVTSGRWEDGMAPLDEAMAAALGGETTGDHALVLREAPSVPPL